ncbi:bifunctional UDP-N-acetylmuramoyl-tripeptide:D-alanyl-D-alanine ligase/alanine racemase [Cloacibacterium normanense]|uniref:Alanine racemase n=1 Tax=Cloacibacterium normanense TaxID=237258 RepID=A0A1E5UCH2_9FLAO|nr:bifunctional UDP-N-acetylmuramoyl-tripeptide:D-alanyl-D-alanine ligase/alanine racemase [Cloacibacterium normanense]AZI70412.1 bifunctional UDP-N-acetylmuramoyl-tripeptide:D-alanyl-D-alanine ligase/alanine racemase [Cloacibacterium normanense]OEL10609.1 alanine racemase [Cloacibacterium normanense]SDO29173.1 alanine racemase [Cloacibacterium normanense]
MNYTTKEIAEITQSQIIGDKNLQIHHIAFDSRNIYSTLKTAFIAINTHKNSGEKYIPQAIEKGIKVIISENFYSEYDGITWIIVENSVKFLQDLAHYHIENHSIKTIGITGSNGKTIVKEWLYQCLWNEFPTVKSPKSFNSQIGLPISLLQTSEKHQVGIFEVGISKPQEMKTLEEIFSPKIGILTHIGTAHSSNFENELQLIKEKLILFKNSEIIIYNGDNEQVCKEIKTQYSDKKLISFGLKTHNDVKIICNYNDRNQEILVQYFSEKLSFPANQRDEATLTNALAVICILKEFGFTNEKIVEKINNLKAVEMRLESVNGVRNNLIINDSFNLDLDSLIIAYQFINQYNRDEKTLILSDIFDVKNDDVSLYHKVAEITNQQNFKQIFLVGNQISRFQEKFNAKTYTFSTTKELLESQQLNSIENQLILLKGARIFEFEKIKSHLELQKHDTVLEINLNAILHNINVHKSLLKPETKMCAMVKAYSYGLGGYEIAEFLQHHHIDYLGVAYADEGVDLRKNGITTPILVMNPEQGSYDVIIDYNLEPEIYSLRVLELFANQLQLKGIQQKYPIHIKVETGMHRLGFKEHEIDELVENLKKYNVKVASIFSHLSSADVPEEDDYTMEQIHTFQRVSSKISEALGYQPIRHILNTAGITYYSDYQFEMVRIGIGMVGISANPEVKKQLQSAVTFKTVISQISEVKQGESIGYNRKYKAEKDTRIATIPVGYADGIPRLIGNKKGFVGIHNQKVSIVGNICMDMLMVDLQNIKAKEGDEVIIFNGNPTLEEFSGYCQTIPYEVLTSISRRVKRIYIKD